MNNADFQKNENHEFNEFNNESLESIKFRCPTCSKLYASDPSQIYVEEPEFTCTSCETEFSISLIQALENSEVIGRPVVTDENVIIKAPDQIELPKKAFSPQTETLEPAEELQREFDFEQLEEGRVSFSELVEEDFLSTEFSQVEEEWALVLKHYESRDAHNKFIEFCKENGELDFAAEQYAKLLKINPNDQIASSFLKKMEFTLDTKMQFDAIKNSSFFSKSFLITAGVVLCGVMMIALGSILLQNKNIAGLGIGLVFFTFAAKAFFQPRPFDD